MRFSLRIKLMGIIVLVIAAMAVVGWRGVDGMRTTDRMLKDIDNNHFTPLKKALQANVAIFALNRAVVNHVLSDDPEDLKSREQLSLDNRIGAENLIQEILESGKPGDSEREMLKLMRSKLDDTRSIQDRIFTLSREGKKAQAGDIMRAELRPVVDRLDAMVDNYVSREEKQLDEAMKSEQEKFHREFMVIIVIIAVAIILALVVSFVFANSIVSRIAEGVNVLSSSASEIVAATTQFASNAAETAASASEATTTMEEVRQTATVSSQKAKYVADSAQKAAEIAKAGKKAVEDTMEGMSGIKLKMESVAESIVTLSEQGQAIGEIIAAVDDIAEQTNVLAVNASIEAVKAGEQGKGFSVVAQEIKALADQSKQSTKRVRAILNDIQKATGKAVMATEDGSKTVDAGARLSTQSGESIQALSGAIAEAAQAAVQIAASSQQQLVGTDQVAVAMENVKTASSQNAAGAKQLETAARNLSDLGVRLKEMVV